MTDLNHNNVRKLDYEDVSDAKVYLENELCINLEKNTRNLVFMKNIIEKLVENLQRNGNSLNKKFLEIGSGPTAFGIIAASKYFSNITLSDISLPNLKYLEQWKNNDGFFHKNIENLFVFAAGLESIIFFDQFLLRVKNSVKRIVKSDLTKRNIIPDEDENEKYDIISSIGTILSIVTNELEIKSVLENIYFKLNNEGIMIITGTLGMKYYYLGKKMYTYDSTTIKFEMIINQMKQIGFEDIFVLIEPHSSLNTNKGVETFAIMAKKLEKK